MTHKGKTGEKRPETPYYIKHLRKLNLHDYYTSFSSPLVFFHGYFAGKYTAEGRMKMNIKHSL